MARTYHGMAGTPLYYRWRAMLDRTTNPNHKGYPNYGARGIKVCERWHQFVNFMEDMGPRFDPSLELDRIDNDKGYDPDNCRWVSHQQQQRNKTTSHVVEYQGRSMTVQEWGEELGIKPNTLVYRLRRGWPVERALTTPTITDIQQRFLQKSLDPY